MGDILTRFKNKHVRIFMSDGFKFSGLVIDEDDDFLILDEGSRGVRGIRKQDIREIICEVAR